MSRHITPHGMHPEARSNVQWRSWPNSNPSELPGNPSNGRTQLEKTERSLTFCPEHHSRQFFYPVHNSGATFHSEVKTLNLWPELHANKPTIKKKFQTATNRHTFQFLLMLQRVLVFFLVLLLLEYTRISMEWPSQWATILVLSSTCSRLERFITLCLHFTLHWATIPTFSAIFIFIAWSVGRQNETPLYINR